MSPPQVTGPGAVRAPDNTSAPQVLDRTGVIKEASALANDPVRNTFGAYNTTQLAPAFTLRGKTTTTIPLATLEEYSKCGNNEERRAMLATFGFPSSAKDFVKTEQRFLGAVQAGTAAGASSVTLIPKQQSDALDASARPKTGTPAARSAVEGALTTTISPKTNFLQDIGNLLSHGTTGPGAIEPAAVMTPAFRQEMHNASLSVVVRGGSELANEFRTTPSEQFITNTRAAIQEHNPALTPEVVVLLAEQVRAEMSTLYGSAGKPGALSDSQLDVLATAMSGGAPIDGAWIDSTIDGNVGGKPAELLTQVKNTKTPGEAQALYGLAHADSFSALDPVVQKQAGIILFAGRANAEMLGKLDGFVGNANFLALPTAEQQKIVTQLGTWLTSKGKSADAMTMLDQASGLIGRPTGAARAQALALLDSQIAVLSKPKASEKDKNAARHGYQALVLLTTSDLFKKLNPAAQSAALTELKTAIGRDHAHTSDIAIRFAAALPALASATPELATDALRAVGKAKNEEGAHGVAALIADPRFAHLAKTAQTQALAWMPGVTTQAARQALCTLLLSPEFAKLAPEAQKTAIRAAIGTVSPTSSGGVNASALLPEAGLATAASFSPFAITPKDETDGGFYAGMAAIYRTTPETIVAYMATSEGISLGQMKDAWLAGKSVALPDRIEGLQLPAAAMTTPKDPTANKFFTDNIAAKRLTVAQESNPPGLSVRSTISPSLGFNSVLMQAYGLTRTEAEYALEQPELRGMAATFERGEPIFFGDLPAAYAHSSDTKSDFAELNIYLPQADRVLADKLANQPLTHVSYWTTSSGAQDLQGLVPAVAALTNISPEKDGTRWLIKTNIDANLASSTAVKSVTLTQRPSTVAPSQEQFEKYVRHVLGASSLPSGQLWASADVRAAWGAWQNGVPVTLPLTLTFGAADIAADHPNWPKTLRNPTDWSGNSDKLGGRDVVKELQRELNAFPAKPQLIPDGQTGPRTYAAMYAFAEKYEYPGTDLLSPDFVKYVHQLGTHT